MGDPAASARVRCGGLGVPPSHHQLRRGAHAGRPSSWPQPLLPHRDSLPRTPAARGSACFLCLSVLGDFNIVVREISQKVTGSRILPGAKAQSAQSKASLSPAAAAAGGSLARVRLPEQGTRWAAAPHASPSRPNTGQLGPTGHLRAPRKPAPPLSDWGLRHVTRCPCCPQTTPATSPPQAGSLRARPGERRQRPPTRSKPHRTRAAGTGSSTHTWQFLGGGRTCVADCKVK